MTIALMIVLPLKELFETTFRRNRPLVKIVALEVTESRVKLLFHYRDALWPIPEKLQELQLDVLDLDLIVDSQVFHHNGIFCGFVSARSREELP
jgi:hypothetical protein